jgi:DNA modification methylase
LDHLTDAQKKAYIIADNKLALNAGWDEELLKLELESLKELDFDIDIIGFSGEELDELFKDNTPQEVVEDEAPEPPENPISKRGDIWLLGRHRLMCGDSTSEDVDVLMDGKKADMVFTDPPYGMFLNADYSDMNSKFKGSTGGNKYENVIGDNEDFKPELITKVLERFDYCKELFMWGADYYAELIPSKNIGSWVVWDKRLDESADKMYGSTFELCWSKARHKRMIARVKWAGIFGMEKEDTKKRCHPTQKPVSLISWFFDYYSLKDKKIVVDVYGGSGSTLIASEQHGKECFMMELDEKYVDVIMQRYVNFKESYDDVYLIRDGQRYTHQQVLEMQVGD